MLFFVLALVLLISVTGFYEIRSSIDKTILPVRCARALILEGLPRLVEIKTRPSHIGVPRKYMQLPFAVQMMRSSYNGVDDLDCFPMDEFQKDFFLFRQNEWEEYRNVHPNCIQGVLNDPLYFDFISFAQYAIISNSFKNAKFDFIEKTGANGTSTVIRRDAAVTNNMLSSLHSQAVGAKLYEYMVTTYPTITPTTASIVAGNIESFVSNAQLLLDIFAINTFALSSTIQYDKVVADSDEVTFRITSVLPANLWSLQVLLARKDDPVNDFEVKVLQYLAALSGFAGLERVGSTVVDNVNVVHTVQLTKRAKKV